MNKTMKPGKLSRNPFMDLLTPEFMGRFFPETAEEVSTEHIAFRPASEIVKKDNAYRLSLALPGVKKEDVKIEIDNNRLTISGERKSEHTDKEDGLLRTEISYGRFSRTFNLSREIDKNGIEASYADGMLHIVLPVSETVLPKAIEIK